MATLEYLIATGRLVKHEPDFDDDELPQRIVCFAPGFTTWLSRTLAKVEPLHGRHLTPHEQVEQILYEFAIGRPMAYSVDYRKLDPPVLAHVWELKTQDVRLFGWFAKRGHFVIVCGELKDNLPKRSDYMPYIQKVISFRDVLDLDEPKALRGVTYNDIF